MPPEFAMMTLVNMDTRGLVILPTHRVVFGLDEVTIAKSSLIAPANFSKSFPTPAIVPTSSPSSAKPVATALPSSQSPVTPASLLHAREGAADQLLKDVPPLQRQLDVVHLHKVLLEHVLGLSEESIRNQENISYHREPEEALARVREGANIAFLMNPIKMEQLREITFAGGVLPQKSTDFYPKLLSGLTIYPVE